MASLFGKTELTPEWVERFNKVAKLNEYAQSHAVQLSDVVLASYDLTGVKLNGATFENTEWKGTQLNKGSLGNTQFKKTKLDGVKFQESVLSDVTFEDVELREVSFFKATLKHVKFIRCKFDAVTADQLKGSDVEFIDSKLVNSSFSEGQLIAVIKNSNLNDVEFTDLEIPSSLTFEKSELKEVKADRSILSSLRATGSKVDATFANTTIETVEFSNDDLDTDLSESTINTITIAASKIKTLRMNSAKVNSVVIDRCEPTKNFGFYKATIKNIQIDRSKLDDFTLAKSNIERLTIANTVLLNSDFELLRAKQATFDHVTLDAKIDFTNAQIDTLTVKGLVKSSGLNLITTGSNVKLD